MCLTIGFLAPIFSKAVGFVLLCRAFTPLPFFPRVSVISALILLAAASGTESCDSQQIEWALVISGFMQGLWAAVVVSGVFYSIELFASWFLSLVLPLPRFLRSKSPQVFQGALFLILLTVSVQTFADRFSGVIVRLFAGSSAVSSGIELAKNIGVDAMHLALLLALPYLATVVILDTSLFVINRFLRVAARSSLQLGIRFPLLVMLLSILLYPHSVTIASNMESFFIHVASNGTH